VPKTRPRPLTCGFAGAAAYAAARRFQGRGEDPEGLEQVALLSLVQAVVRFDPSRGVAFSTFAVPTVVGSLKRHFRDRSWAVRPPRSVQERYLEVAALRDALTNELGRAPNVAEIAARGKCSQDQVHEALDAAYVHRRHQQWGTVGDYLFAEPGSVEDGFERVEHHMLIERLLDELPERERSVIRLRFFEGLTQSAIGRRLGVSQMHVSRLLARTLEQLRVRVERAVSPP
jgi:RNA polymerase sigma-B factor